MQKNRNRRAAPVFTDQGPEPYTVNIERAALLNSNFRTALWTGEHLQATLMSIPEQIGLEAHPTLDQFLKIVDGTGLVLMAPSRISSLFGGRCGGAMRYLCRPVHITTLSTAAAGR